MEKGNDPHTENKIVIKKQRPSFRVALRLVITTPEAAIVRIYYLLNFWGSAACQNRHVFFTGVCRGPESASGVRNYPNLHILFHQDLLTSQRMKRIDWYIFKKLIVTFFFCMILFTLITVAVDSSEHTENFVKSGLSTSQIITQYYIGFIPYIWGLLFPLFVFIAVIYSTSRMAVRSEIIAIIASGTSFNRFLRPYLVGGIFLALILYLASREIIPRGNEIRSNFQEAYIDKTDPTKFGRYQDTYYRRSDTNTYVGIKYYDSLQKYAGGFFLHRVKDNQVIYNLRADAMKWDTTSKRWQLTNVVERKINPLGEEITRYPVYYINLNIQPQELRQDYYLKDKLTTRQLKQYIKIEELRGTEGLNTLKVERYRRSATPFSVILLTLIGAIIASKKTRGGSGFHIAIGFIIAALFILTDRFSTTFSVKGDFHPLIAAWLPNLLFAVAGLWLYIRAPK
jgi:lipopolysaccharide export system permease protein